MKNIGFLGLDIGSTTVKVALLDENCNHLFEPIYIRSVGQPLLVLRQSLHAVLNDFSGDVIVAVTGSGRDIVRRALNLPQNSIVTEIYAHASGACHIFPGVRSIIDIGGQDNKLIRLRPDSDGSISIQDFVMNDLCAAGTGAFLEMHAKELGYSSIEEFGERASRSNLPSRIAGRCSILAHSDVVHLRQSGEDLDNIAAGLCRAVVINVLAMGRNKTIEPPILFQGGVAANAGVVNALRRELNLDETGLIVPPHYKTIGAIGVALHAMKYRASGSISLSEILDTLDGVPCESSAKRHFTLGPLRYISEKSRSGDLVRTSKDSLNGDVVIGFDVGSASVKIAVLDMNGKCVFTHYALHDGKPIEALYKGLREFRQVAGDVKPRCWFR